MVRNIIYLPFSEIILFDIVVVHVFLHVLESECTKSVVSLFTDVSDPQKQM